MPGATDLFRKRPCSGLKSRLHALAAGRGWRSDARPVAPQAAQEGAGVTHERMVERYAPPSVLISPGGEILHYSAHAGRYLRVPGGAPTHDLCRLVGEPLASELSRALREARRRRRPVRTRPLSVQGEEAPRQLVISVRLSEDPDLGDYLLVIFDELDQELPPARDEGAGLPADADHSASLAAEQIEPRYSQYPPSDVDEELQAFNEELQSDNEELRAVVEELEGSKEELQSLNEKLSTVNDESARRLDELTRLNADLRHFHAAAQTPTLFLDWTLNIVRFTPQAEALFHLRESDSGRPLSDLTNRLDYPDLQWDVRTVLAGRDGVEREVGSDSACWYLVRILPYRSDGTTTEGVVITLVDISARRRAEQALRESEKRFRALVNASSFVVYRMSPDWSEMWELDGRGFIADTAKPKKDWLDAYIHPDDQPTVLAAIDQAVREKRMFALEHRVRRVDGTLGWTSSRAVPLLNEAGEITEWFGAASDVTERHEAEQALRAGAGAAHDHLSQG